MLSEMCEPHKKGVRLLRMVGPFAILINIELLRRGKCTRYCIVHLKDRWVEGWADDERAAIHMARAAIAAIEGVKVPQRAAL